MKFLLIHHVIRALGNVKMATGGEVDSRVVCSVCLEPYKGRQPKLLPCFHTFCLPCLTALHRRATRQVCDGESAGQADESESSGKDNCYVEINCPTCRKVIPVPPGGVNEFQSNFYIDNDGDTALTHAQQGNEDDIEELRNKLENQVKVLKEVLAIVAEEEAQVERQRRSAEHDINVQYAAGLGLLANARDDCFISLRDTAQAVRDALQQEMMAAHRLEAKLSWFVSQDTLPHISSKSELQAALISGSEFEELKKRVDKGKRAQFFTYTPMDKQAAPVKNILHSYMGTASLFVEGTFAKAESPVSEPDKLTITDPSTTGLSDNTGASNTLMVKVDSLVSKVQMLEGLQAASEGKIATLQRDNTALHQKFGSVHDTLEGKHAKVQGEVNYARDKNAILCQDVASLRAEVTRLRNMVLANDDSRQNMSMQKTVESVQQEIRAMKTANTAVSTQVAALQKDNSTFNRALASSQNEIGAVRKDTGTIQDSLQQMRRQLATGNAMVAFQARLTSNVQTTRKQILIFKHVMLNVGGGYNSQTGIFTAPVSGLYIFMATVREAEDGEYAKLDIVLENNPIAFAVSNDENDSCSCHAAVKVVAGQDVWLRTFDTRSSFLGQWASTFTGVLIQPEI